jgi:uncharacterized protein with NRDE domain
MCTLILGREVTGPGTLLLAANRDEDPGRPTDPPLVLSEAPRVVGGRDRIAGGTWLALREGPRVVALLNRYDPAGSREATRSRGLLTLDVARAPDESLRERTLSLVQAERYAPFTLLVASAHECWMVIHEGGPPRIVDVDAGWHVLTHRELDDPGEPRAAYLVHRLREAGFRDGRPEELAIRLLREHGESGTPPVCLHEGRMRTVSSSMIGIGSHRVRYLHAEGRPCESAYVDRTGLLEPALEKGRS